MSEPAEKYDIEEQKSQRKIIEMGWYAELSNEDYHGSSGYSSSSLKVLLEKTMAHLDYQRSHPSGQTENMLLGSIVHTLCLEPHAFEHEYAIRPMGIRKPTEAQLTAKKPSDKTLVQIEEWLSWQSQLETKTEITAEMYNKAKAMADKVLEHPMAGLLIEDGIVEHSVFYWYNPEDWDEETDYRIPLKVRPDLIKPGHHFIFDLKTTADAGSTKFGQQAKKLNYHTSAAMYLDGCNRHQSFCEYCGVVAFTGFNWIVVENQAPYEVAIYEMTDDQRHEGMQRYHTAVRRLHEYKKSEWKGYGEQVNGKILPIARPATLPNPNFGNIIV